MTPEQATQLDTQLRFIQLELNSFTIPSINTDDYDADQTIANARIRLHKIDALLFRCFRVLEKFYDTNRPTYKQPTPRRPAYTVDDLEI